MTTPFNICDLRPADTPEYMTGFWIGCISFAIQTPEIVEQFRKATGNQWMPGRTPIDRLVDEATGADLEFLKQFVQWVNVNVWGPIEADRAETTP